MLAFDYEAEVKKGYISKRQHSENPDVIILNYTDECVYEKYWNEATMSCRGLILNERTGEVLARPFKKFFNYNENSGIVTKIPKGEPTISVKLDGSLGISYVLDNTLHWATRGSFESLQAGVANEIWKKKYSHVTANEIEGLTLLVEIIDKKTRVVVNYEGMSDLILIGVIRIHDGYDFSHEEMVVLAKKIGMKVNEKTNLSLEQALSKKHEIDTNEEGWVLRWKNGFRLKIKGDKYMDVHRIVYGLSNKKKFESWADGNLLDLIRTLPEEFRVEIESFAERLDVIDKTIKHEVLEFYNVAIQKFPNDRKAFAQYVLANGKKEYTSFYFQLCDEKIPSIKEFIYKNYRDFLEGE